MAENAGWSLEVVRGVAAGRRYALGGGTVLIGNALQGAPGLDLSELEQGSLRKMAARQAQLHVVNGSLTLRDLNSPGGTFVDRRRIPPNSDLPLKEGDVIQVGGVQLRVTRGDAPAPPPPTAPSASPPRPASGFLFTLRTGATCRAWDDFLVVAAQQWDALRDELTSGRLAGFLATSGRGDLAPDPRAPGSPDERLDAWIGRLPTTRPARPEIDVHPTVLTILAPAGGGVVRKTVRVSNTGERLLRVKARVEPAGGWIGLVGDAAGRELTIVESAEVAFEATLPESLSAPLTADLVFEGNGGAGRVVVRAEPAEAKGAEPIGGGPAAAAAGTRWRERVAAIPAATRLRVWTTAAILGRLGISGADTLIPSGSAGPGLLGPLVMFAAIGALLGIRAGRRGGDVRDLPSTAFAGGVLGAMAAAVAVALCRTLEAPIAGRLGVTWASGAAVWGALGAALAGASLAIAPPIGKGGAQ